MKSTLITTTAVIALLALSGCGEDKASQKGETAAQAGATVAEATAPVTESERLNVHFEKTFMRDVMDSPEFQTYLGMKKDYGKWDERTEEKAAADHARTIADLKTLQEDFDYEKLDEATKLSYRLAERQLKEQIEGYKWRYHGYPVNQMFGWQSSLPSFLINFHRVTSVEDLEAYISRLEGVQATADQRMEMMKRNQEKGVLPPKFVFAYVMDDARNVLKGAPFTEGEDSTLMADFKKKLTGLKLEDADKAAELTKRAEAALLSSVKPAYESLMTLLEAQEAVATTEDGAWKLPDGEEFYTYRLRQMTSTDMTADEIHQLGLDEVARIHNEMRDIMKQVKFDGTLQEFFEFTRTDKQFYYPETDEGKTAYLKDATDLINIMKEHLDEVFITKPKADLIVKQVEAFREKSAGKAFYNRPAPDGSRPGIYYANLYKMTDMPTYQMEALAYHEGIPGHHMQLAIQQELQDIPKFRKFGGYTAYTEGWGLYSEYLPKEMGFYSDPYSDFGRLAMEIWRACRLVVDTGIHYKKWTREQAIEYLAANTPNPHGDVVKAIERYIVMPGQATAYKIGMNKILELRAHAKAELGDKFDIRKYHEVVLRDGALPLAILEEKVNEWIASQK
ncbi:DUF885 domain-containing protein [Paremcibacter congregatus]|uniref:DUF885 domain-containing protein n=1 Tax=Paremcibacter congregatus TaxID=2043170 RepID=A0A2G4YSR0_9PROT|nr:DUF885 domain-containing protein [Paremcibacter congregatus]PHZ85307.1 DUF885 domain-containing protein [Paremcibacter congregatus]QDE27761.1 DUF885 domain-containing protein [Paremcibacter congregatus]